MKKKFVKFCTEPIKFELSNSIPKAVNLKLYRVLIIESTIFPPIIQISF